MEKTPVITELELNLYNQDIAHYIDAFLQETVEANQVCVEDIMTMLQSKVEKHFDKISLKPQIEHVLGLSILNKYQNNMMTCKNNVDHLYGEAQAQSLSFLSAFEGMISQTKAMMQEIQKNAIKASGEPKKAQERQAIEKIIVLELSKQWGRESTRMYENQIRETVQSCYETYSNRVDNEDMKVVYQQLLDRTDAFEASKQSIEIKEDTTGNELPRNVIF